MFRPLLLLTLLLCSGLTRAGPLSILQWPVELIVPGGTLHGSPVGDSLTISAGIACYPSHALNAPELVISPDAIGKRA